MKKNLFLIGLAAVLFTACSENDALDNSNNDNNPIGFDTYVGKQTRASVIDQNNLTEFGVYAYLNTAGTELMQNEQISKNQNGTWTYTNIKYWPENDSVNFFAYAPRKAPLTGYSKENKSFSFTVNAAVNAQEDLIAATAFDRNKGINGGKVNLIFRHLLSKIGFAAKLADNYKAKVTVTGLEVLYKDNAIANKSTFTFSTANDSGSFETTTNEAGSWGTPESNQFLAGTSDELITDTVVITTTIKNLNTNGSASAPNTYLMMLPQALAAGDIVAKITYTVDYENPTATVTNTVKVDLPPTTWEMGKAYTYNFNIGMTGIVFDTITVSDWVDGTQPVETPAPTPAP